MRSPEAVLFDFDGTLVDSAGIISRCFNGALTGRRLPPVEAETVRGMIGRPLTEMFASVLESPGDGDIEMLINAYRILFQRVDPASFQLLPGAADLVSALRGRCRVAIVTSRSGLGTARILEAQGLSSRVDTVVGIEDVRHSKPHPQPVHLALERLGIEARRAVMIGDTGDDVAAGRSAGTLTVGVTTGAHTRLQLTAAGADRVVDRLAELREWLVGG